MPAVRAKLFVGRSITDPPLTRWGMREKLMRTPRDRKVRTVFSRIPGYQLYHRDTEHPDVFVLESSRASFWSLTGVCRNGVRAIALAEGCGLEQSGSASPPGGPPLFTEF